MDKYVDKMYDEFTDTSYEVVLVEGDSEDEWLCMDYDLEFDYDNITI